MYPSPLGRMVLTPDGTTAVGTDPTVGAPDANPAGGSTALPGPITTTVQPAPYTPPPAVQLVPYPGQPVNSVAGSSPAPAGGTIGTVLVLGILAWWGLSKGGGRGRSW